jgi:hypothetical protein
MMHFDVGQTESHTLDVHQRVSWMIGQHQSQHVAAVPSVFLPPVVSRVVDSPCEKTVEQNQFQCN